MTKRTLADKIGTVPRSITRYESGDAVPANDVLPRLAEELAFPLSFFFAPAIEPPAADGVSFRSMSSMTAAKRHAALAASAIGVELSDWIAQRFELPATSLPELRGYDPEAAADAVRAAWGLGSSSIKNLVHLLEAHGVRVFSLPPESREIDAFSFWRGEVPFVFLNTMKSAEHGRFDAAHELAHLLLHRHGGPRGRDAERESDVFAASLLMPRASVLAAASGVPAVLHMIQMKREWNVSVAALNRRLYDVGLTTEWTYRAACIEIARRGYRGTEPLSSKRETSQVLQKVFTALRAEGTGKPEIAAALHVNEAEIDGLMFGLVLTHLSGNPHAPPTMSRPSRLRRL